MKKLSACLLLCLSMVGCKVETYHSPDGSIPAAFEPYLTPFTGHYQSPRGDVALALDHGYVRLTSNFDVSGWNCGAKLGVLRSVRVYPGKNDTVQSGAPFDAQFDLDVGRCKWLPTRTATFHFNRTLTGVGVFQLSVMMKEGRYDSQSATSPEYRTWWLKRASN